MKAYFLKMFDFEHWANTKLMMAMREIETPPARAHSVFCHLIAANRIWFSRIMGKAPGVVVWENFDMESWEKELEYNRALLREFVHGLDEAGMERMVSYTNFKGVAYTTSVSDILSHLIAHSCYHQGQIVSLLKPVVQALPDIIYITYVREQGKI